MTPIGSLQLRRYRVLRRGGITMATACATAGLPIGEARLTDAEDLKFPPEPACFVLADDDPVLAMITPAGSSAEETRIGPTITDEQAGVAGSSPSATVPAQSASATPSTTKGPTMGRPKRKPAEQVEQIEAPDYDGALRIYREDIKPAASKVGEHNQELSSAYKAIKKQCRIPGWVMKLGIKLDGMEEAKRDVEMRALSGLLSAMKIGITRDIVDAAEGKDAPEVIPTVAARPKIELVAAQ